jgi:hypothetical protein
LAYEPPQGVAEMNAAFVVDNEDADGRIFRHCDLDASRRPGLAARRVNRR